MALTPCSVATNNIATVGTNVAERGLTTDQFKAKFDKYGADFVAWFNATHLAEGHIVESGSNANGSYIKFNDGTMICTFSTATFNVNTVYLSYYFGETSWTFPVSFISAPVVNFAITSLYNLIGGRIAGILTGSAGTFRVYSLEVNSTASLQLVAIGKWK